MDQVSSYDLQLYPQLKEQELNNQPSAGQLYFGQSFRSIKNFNTHN